MVRNYTRKQIKWYSPEDLRMAVNEVNENVTTLTEIAKRWNIPSTTLSEKVRGLHPGKQGRACALSEVDERRIAECIAYSGDCGWPLDRGDLLDIIKSYCQEANLCTTWDGETGPGIEYIRNFERRWNHLLSKRKTVILTKARANLSHDVIGNFFKIVREVYKKTT
jgi:hypothetical protein